MTGNVFIDSNIWIYLFTFDNDNKNKIANDFIFENVKNNRIYISYQVINEVCYTLKRKKYKELELRQIVNDMFNFCDVPACSNEVIFTAFELRDRYAFSYWDSQIVASALISNCSVLASEDMQNNLQIKNMRIKNIFN